MSSDESLSSLSSLSSSSSSSEAKKSHDCRRSENPTICRRSVVRRMRKREKRKLRSNFANGKYHMDLKKWPILNLLKPEFASRIDTVMVFGSGTECNGALIITRNKMVYALGKNSKGRLGIGFIKYTLRPTIVSTLCRKGIKTLFHRIRPGPRKFSQVFALTEEGEVYCWGDNNGKSLGLGLEPGLGTKETVRIPTHLTSLQHCRIIDIACGEDHCLALTNDGKVYTWGLNIFEARNGIIIIHYTPVQVKDEFDAKKIVYIACGRWCSVTVTDNSDVYTWGDNFEVDSYCAIDYSGDDNYPSIENCIHNVDNNYRNNNRCIREIFENFKMPHKIFSQKGIKIVKAVCGSRHAIMLSDKGELYVWGQNNCGQLGTGNKENVLYPIKLEQSKMGKVVDIAAIYCADTSVALNKDGRIYVWGSYSGLHIVLPTVTLFSNMHDVFAFNNSMGIMHRPLIMLGEELSVLKSVETMFDDPATSDLTIKVKGKPIYVHKAMLRARCEYFRNMFQHNWAESNQNVIENEQFSYPIYKAFLKYLYTGVIDLSPEDAFNLITLTEVYCETKLKEVCVCIIKENITVSNLAFIYDKAKKYNLKELEKYCYKFAEDRKKSVILTEICSKWNEKTKDAFMPNAANAGSASS